jgi:Flp pilus assembly protein TadD
MVDDSEAHTCTAGLDLAAELATTRTALARGELDHAAFHIAEALVSSPLDGEVHALIEELLTHNPSFALGAPDEGGEYAGRAALRAVLARRQGDGTLAIETLLQVHRALPDAGFVGLLDVWFPEAESLRGIDPTRLAGAFAALLEARRNAAAAKGLLTQICAAHPDSEAMHVLDVRLLRRLEGPALALPRSEDLARRLPSWLTFITLGATYRELGELGKARTALLRAAELDPRDPSLHLDLGDWAIEDGDLRTAIQHYDQALALAPEQPWALASRAYLAVLTGEPSEAGARATLRRLAVEGNARARSLHGELVPFDLALEPPGSSLVHVAKQVRADGLTLTGNRVAVSSFEPPSAVRAAALIAGEVLPEDLVSFGEIPTPDPRLPRCPVEHALWSFRGPGLFGRLRALRSVGAPALAPPPP